MRKIALFVICLSMLIALVGCGQSQIPSDTKQEKVDTTEQVEKADNKEGKSILIRTTFIGRMGCFSQ